MTIGLIAIGIIAVLLLFGALETTLERVGVSPSATFIVLALWAASVFIPPMDFGGVRLGIAGFAAPFVISLIMGWKAFKEGGLISALVAGTGIAAIVVPVELFVFGNGIGFDILASVLVGIGSGAIAFLISSSAAGSVGAILGGTFFGDLVATLISTFARGESFYLGDARIFGLIATSLLVGVVAYSVFLGFAGSVTRMGIRRNRAGTEASEEFDKADYFDDYFGKK